MTKRKTRLTSVFLAAVMCLSMVSDYFPQAQISAYASQANTITSFEKLDTASSSIIESVENKSSLENLLKKMPKTLAVHINGSLRTTDIPVSWECVGDDYETSSGYYFQFSPVIGDDYRLGSSMDLIKDAPYIGVFLLAQDKSGKTGKGLLKTLKATLSTAVVKQTNAVTIYNYLVSNMGYNSAAACGVLANIYWESGFKSDIWERGYTKETGAGYGICQWTNYPRTSESGRRTNLFNYCTNNGYDSSSLDGQLHYLQYELTETRYKSVNAKLLAVENSAQGAYDAGYIWCYYFEVPKDYPSVSVTRGNLARDSFWPVYGTLNAYSTDSGLTIDWSSVFSSTYYDIFKGDDLTNQLASHLTTTNYTDTAVTSGQTYSYTVKAYSTPDYPAVNIADYAVANPVVTFKKIKTSDTNIETPFVNISGQSTVGSVLTANLEGYTAVDGDNSSYKWTLYDIPTNTTPEDAGNLSAIYDAKNSTAMASSTYLTNSNTLELKAEYVGKTIICEITTNTGCYSSEITSTIASTKYITDSTPVIVGTSPTSSKGATDGKIYVQNTNGYTVEYSTTPTFDDACTNRTSDTDANGNIVITAAKGNYYIRYVNTDTSKALTYSSPVIGQITDLDGISSVTNYYYLSKPVLSVLNGDAYSNQGSNLTWQPVTGADGYNIYKSTNLGEFTLIKSVTADMTTYLDNDAVTNGTGYQYKIVATHTDTATTKQYISCDSAVITTCHLASPTIKSISNVSGKMTLSWKAISGATAYRVYRKSANATTFKKIATVSDTTYTDKGGKKNGVSYSYKVLAVYSNEAGITAKSKFCGAKAYTFLTTPKISSVKCKYSKALSVFYNKNTKSATGYEIEYSTSKKMTKSKTAKITSAYTGAYRLTGLKKGKAYYVRVRSYKKVGKKTYYSGWSTIHKKKVTK